MRYSDIINESLVTLEVKDGQVCQARGYANRDLTKEENLFVKKWAKAKGLNINY